MRHLAVKRAAIMVGGACLVWIAVVPFLVDDDRPVTPPMNGTAPPQPAAPATVQDESGDALYARHCAACHEVTDMRSRAGRDTDPSRRASLETFLAGHSDASATENRRILDFLSGVEPGGAPGP
jgi:mono/diheme cytochrome c family protein